MGNTNSNHDRGGKRGAGVSQRLYALPAILLVATVPIGPAGAGALGIPSWAITSFLVTVAYAIVVAVALGRSFDESGEQGDGRSDDGHGEKTP